MSPTEHGPREIRSTFASTTGGVMTEEVGAVTGDLELATLLAEGSLRVFIRYAGADEWYSVEGDPIALASTIPPTSDEHLELHERILGHLIRPARIVDGNELAVSLASFSAEP